MNNKIIMYLCIIIFQLNRLRIPMKTNPKELKAIKIFPSYNCTNIFSPTDSILKIAGISSTADVDHEIFLISNIYEYIFGTTKKKSDKRRKQLSIIKISANGHSIYRLYRAISAKGFSGKHAALTYSSLLLLANDQGEIPNEIIMSKGNFLSSILFYWNHPNMAIRSSIKLGILSVTLGFLSLLISLLYI